MGHGGGFITGREPRTQHAFCISRYFSPIDDDGPDALNSHNSVRPCSRSGCGCRNIIIWSLVCSFEYTLGAARLRLHSLMTQYKCGGSRGGIKWNYLWRLRWRLIDVADVNWHCRCRVQSWWYLLIVIYWISSCRRHWMVVKSWRFLKGDLIISKMIQFFRLTQWRHWYIKTLLVDPTFP